MSLNPKSMPEYLADIDEDNDSFHSFVQTEGDSDDLENLSSIDDDDTITDEHEFELEPNLKIPDQFAVGAVSSSSSTASERAYELENNFNIPYCGVSRSLTDSARALKPSNYQLPKLTPRKPWSNHHLVPELRCDSPMPAMELFDMNEPKQKETGQRNTEALQKYAFTEIWVEGQQNCPERKRSMRRDFTAALENYFLQSTDQFQKLTLEEKEKGAINKQLFVDPTKSSADNSASFQTVPEIKPYVSPFEGLPVGPVEKKLPGQKSYITVPAGYDLTNLIKYKDPNHWHRRSTTRYDSRP